MSSTRGVELILDAVGGDSLKKDYRLLAPTGRIGVFGASSAATNKRAGYRGMASMVANTSSVQFNPLSLMNANKGVFGFNLGHLLDEFDRVRGWMDQLISLREIGAIKPKIARVFKFDQAPAAHHFIQDRKNIGKVLLAPLARRLGLSAPSTYSSRRRSRYHCRPSLPGSPSEPAYRRRPASAPRSRLQSLFLPASGSPRRFPRQTPRR
jgi:Zinc-binding dehydrogenase